MAHGSPDHTLLVEQNFAHYVDHVAQGGVIPAHGLVTWTNVLNVDLQGVFGYCRFWADHQNFAPRITIDGVVVFINSILALRGGGLWGYSGSGNKYKVTQYDQVSAVNQFCMYYDEKWGLYIHSNLTVDVHFELPAGLNATYYVQYKQYV